MRRYSSYRNSYRKRNSVGTKLFVILRYLLFLYFAYTFITLFLVSSYTVQTSAMEKSIHKGQRLLAAPVVFGTEIFDRIRIPAIRTPARGDIVIFTRREIPFPMKTADSLIRFFTLQHYSIIRKKDQSWTGTVSAGRIIGIPGDTVKLENFEAFIKPRGESEFYPENRIIGKKYSPEKEELPPGWDRDKPFSGHMKPVTLAADEYFILNDNRAAAGDSRFSGPVKRKDIVAPVFLAYMPGFSFK